MLRRVLQIVHVTDLHLVHSEPGALSGATERDWVDEVTALLERAGHYVGKIRRYCEELKQGTAGHDHHALDEFTSALRAVLDSGHPDWRALTWLIATGDLSTWGDDRSIADALDWLRNTADAHKISWTAIYGNHDVWLGDGSVPRPWDPAAPFSKRRTQLRTNYFPGTWPLIPLANTTTAASAGLGLSVSLSGGSRLIGCSLNTVVHEPNVNFAALGEVRQDRYWENQQVAHPPQLDDLQTHLRSDDIVLLFMHHPVHYPNRDPNLDVTSVLRNAPRIAQTLQCRSAVIVSGHTHGVFPKLGHLPQIAGTPQHAPLANRRAQLIGGTLSQRAVEYFQAEFQQCWQLLRFWEEDSSGEVQVERLVLTRTAGTGAFLPVASGTEKMQGL
jgi:3',5'-cyclic AMP phosphodiesterase CpdA